MVSDRNIYISTSALVKLALSIVLFSFLYVIKDILALFFVALVLSTAITPTVQNLERHGIRKIFTIVFIYVVMLAIIFFFFVTLIPLIIDQGVGLVQYLQSYLDEIKADGSILGRYKIDLNKTTTSVVDSISSVFKYSVDAFLALFDNAVSLMVVIVATFYMVLEVASINKAILFFVPKHHQAYINELIDLIRQKTGMWLRGQLILCLVVGLCAYAGLVFLDVKYALILALLFGIGELIPYLGPSIAAVPAVFLAFMQERSLGLSVIGLYVIIQVLENNFIVPAVMRKVVGINPIVTIFALLIGGKVAGVIGMVLAIPVVTAINIIITSYFDSQEKKEENIAEANL